MLASSFPIPHGFLKDVEIDSSGTKLYANYSGAGNIVVFDVDALILQAGSKLNDWSRLPLDHPQAGGVDIHGGFQAIDVEQGDVGLTLQPNARIELIGPSG